MERANEHWSCEQNMAWPRSLHGRRKKGREGGGEGEKSMKGKTWINLGFWEAAHFSPRAKRWLRGGVGGQFPRKLNWSKNVSYPLSPIPLPFSLPPIPLPLPPPPYFWHLLGGLHAWRTFFSQLFLPRQTNCQLGRLIKITLSIRSTKLGI